MKGIGIFHAEFSGAHDTKAWTTLIAKLGLNLIEVGGQLFIAVNFIANNIGDHFFVSRAETEFAVMAIFNAQQLRTHFVPAARLLPEIGRLNHGHH